MLIEGIYLSTVHPITTTKGPHLPPEKKGRKNRKDEGSGEDGEVRYIETTIVEINNRYIILMINDMLPLGIL